MPMAITIAHTRDGCVKGLCGLRNELGEPSHGWVTRRNGALKVKRDSYGIETEPSGRYNTVKSQQQTVKKAGFGGCDGL